MYEVFVSRSAFTIKSHLLRFGVFARVGGSNAAAAVNWHYEKTGGPEMAALVVHRYAHHLLNHAAVSHCLTQEARCREVQLLSVQ